MTLHRVRRILSGSPSGRNDTRVAGAIMSLSLLVTLVASLALASAGAPKSDDGESTALPDKTKATDSATKDKGPVKKTARKVFRPTTNKSGQTSWSSLFRPREQNKLFGEQKDGEKQRMMLVRAHRGDRWPVKLEGSAEALFHAELVDGNDKQVELKIIEGQVEKRLVLKLDQPETLELAGKAFVFSYGSTMIEADEPKYTDDAHIIITLPDKSGAGTEVPGWNLAGAQPTNYAVAIDSIEKHGGAASGSLRYTGEEPSKGFGTLSQTISADEYRGKRLRMTAYAKSKDVENYAGLWARVDGEDKFRLAFDNMGDRPIKGSTEWTEYSIVLDVPDEAASIAFGVLMNGKGQVWLDDLRFELVGQEVKITGFDVVPAEFQAYTEETKNKRRQWLETLPKEPQNPGFEAK